MSDNAKYKNEFKKIKILGSGGFGVVVEAKNKLNELFAIKIIPYNEKDTVEINKEVELLKNSKSDYVVEYHSSWSEPNHYNEINSNEGDQDPIFHKFRNPDKNKLLYIQMELCVVSLAYYINLFKSNDLESKNKLTVEQYKFNCDLFAKLLKCVQYLHQNKIIHRDLKPENILLTISNNGWRVKLTDFGLSTRHDSENQSYTKYTGTKSYIAPEVNQSNHYDFKSDIYSLGNLMDDIFNLDINQSIPEDTNEEIKLKYNRIWKISIKCQNCLVQKRPNCDEILSEQELWMCPEIKTPTQISQTLPLPPPPPPQPNLFQRNVTVTVCTAFIFTAFTTFLICKPK